MAANSFKILARKCYDSKPGRFAWRGVCTPYPLSSPTRGVEYALAVLSCYFRLDNPTPACSTLPYAFCRTLGVSGHYCPWRAKLEQRRRPGRIPGCRMAYELRIASSQTTGNKYE